MNSWSLIEIFVTVARAGSMTEAARQLGSSQPTISRRIQELEERLGETLFVRHGRGLVLSDRGERLLESARHIELQVQELFRRAPRDTTPLSGTVRLSAIESVGSFLLMDCFACLRRMHPDLSLELVIEESFADLSRREADIGLRMARPQQPDIIAWPIGRLEMALFASEAYLSRRGAPQDLVALRAHMLVGRQNHPRLKVYLSSIGLQPKDIQFRSNSTTARLQAVRAGVGIGGLACRIAATYPELRRVLPGFWLPSAELWLAIHRDLRQDPAIRAVVAAIQDALAAELEPLSDGLLS